MFSFHEAVSQMVEMEEQVVEDHRTVFQVKDGLPLCFIVIQESRFSQWKCILLKMEEHLICLSKIPKLIYYVKLIVSNKQEQIL